MDNLAEFRLENGKIAKISFLSRKDKVTELQSFINKLITEKTYILMDKKTTIKEEKKWKKEQLEAFKKKQGYLLVARVDGKIAGTSGAMRGRFKERDNVCLGIGLAKEYRRIGLGKALLGLNITLAKKRLKPKNIYLNVLAPNKPAQGLYKKLGFKQIAVFPKWIKHKGEYVDYLFMRL